MVTAMLISSGMSQDMWEEAILMATYLLNNIPRKDKEETPYELWMGRKPLYRYLRVWGCLAKVAVPAPKAQKIRPKSLDCIFIGYAKNNRHQWKEAIKSKIDSILQNHTWELVDLPHGCKPLGYKWIFKKMKVDGTIDKYKASNEKMIKSTKDMLKSKFDMKDMGLADVILGIKIIRTQNRLVLSQAHYVDKILNTHNAGDSGLARTLIDTAYSISRLSRYTSNLINAHWKAMTRVLRYLRYSHDYGLHYDRHPAVTERYNDANWKSDIKDSRSTSEYVFTLGGAAISWKSSK
nr:retrotransposon protein, putative, Ty1-copia subclass [Tanacetum cinerariifolium]